MYYYAIQVRTGSELTVAKKIDLLNKKLNGHLVTKIIVPFSIKTTFDGIKGAAYQRQGLLFNSYIFIAHESLTPEAYLKIKEVSTLIYKIFEIPISVEEMKFLANGDITDFIVEVSGLELQAAIQEKCRELVAVKKLDGKKNGYYQFLLPTHIVKSILMLKDFTIRNITNKPIKFIKEVLNLYDTFNGKFV